MMRLYRENGTIISRLLPTGKKPGGQQRLPTSACWSIAATGLRHPECAPVPQHGPHFRCEDLVFTQLGAQGGDLLALLQ
jgi:hypothetical protein